MGKSGPYMSITESPDGRRTVRVSRAFVEELLREVLDEEDRETPDVVAGSDETPKGKGKDVPAPDETPDDSQEVPDEQDPADDEIEADAEGEPEPRGDKLADELIGKTVQSVTMEPKSKILPGAQEIVLTFNEITDPLRILVGKTGQVRFFFRNSLHNLI